MSNCRACNGRGWVIPDTVAVRDRHNPWFHIDCKKCLPRWMILYDNPAVVVYAVVVFLVVLSASLQAAGCL